MKTILLSLGADSLLLLGSSCRTFVPLDPNTYQPSCRMMPDKVEPCCSKQDCTPCCKGHSHAKGKVEASK